MAITKVSTNVVDDQVIDRRNLIINGDMRIAQRGTTSTSANYKTVDRFRNGFGGVTLTQSQQALTSGSPYDEGFRNFLRLTQSGSSSTATDFVQIAQRIQGRTAASSGWNYKSTSSKVTISFWVRSSLAGTYYIYMNTRSGNGDGYINAPFTISANTWTKVTHSFSGNASNIDIDDDNTTGIELRVVPYYGTNYTSNSITSNSWFFGTGSGELPNFAQNWTTSSGATFDLTGVQLEVGDIATPFEHRSFAEELALCQAYYYRLVSATEGSNYRFGIGCGVNTNALDTMFQFSPEMNGTPSLDAMTAGNYRTNFNATATNIYIVHATRSGCCVRSIHADNTVEYKGCELLCPSSFTGHDSLDAAYIAFEAEL